MSVDTILAGGLAEISMSRKRKRFLIALGGWLFCEPGQIRGQLTEID